jgi:hypothetical protein
MNGVNTSAAEVLIPEGYRRDAKGRLIPENLVRPIDLLEDQLVDKLHHYADALSAEIGRFKAHTFEDVGSFLDLIDEQYGAKRGGTKGNLTFTSYDGLKRVTVQVADRLVFGPELQTAKTLIDDCIVEWAEGASDNIRVLVDHAFRVDREGQVSRAAVFALRRIEIDDDRWRSAMTAIADSVRVAGTTTYVRFHTRERADLPWKAVSLDIASA